MTDVATRPVTAHELLAMPRGQVRRELVAGEIREMSPAGGMHGEIAFHIAVVLGRALERTPGAKGFGAETGFLVARDPDTVRAPDAAVVTAERAARAGDLAGYWPGAPDLAVEVVSPNDTWSELTEKALAWLAAGTRIVLLVDPGTRTVTRYGSAADVQVLEGEQPVNCAAVLPGFAPAARAFFP